MPTKNKKERKPRKPRVPKVSQKQKQKQNVKQETNVNIKIGEQKRRPNVRRKTTKKSAESQQQQVAAPSFVFNPTILTQPQPSMAPVTYIPPVYQPEPRKAESIVTPNIIRMRELNENAKMKVEDIKSKKMNNQIKQDNTPFSGQVSAGFIPSEAPALMAKIQEIKNAPSAAGGSIQHAIKKYENGYNSEGERMPSRKGRTLPFTSPSPVQAQAVLAGGAIETGYETAIPLGPVRMLSQNPTAVLARERRQRIKEGKHIVKSRKKKDE